MTHRIERWIGRNAQRVYIVIGVYSILMAGFGLYHGVYWQSILPGVLGGWLLGGWPALKRLATNPRMQLTHWYHILRNTRKVEIREFPDGSKRVSIMKPVRTNGWYWKEDREHRD